MPTVKDILSELEKPGRDPRPEFKTATFKEGVEKIGDLQPGMMLEGVVTNVAAFGAFVDIGVHQDGLVHISALADTFVKDPRNVVKPGDIVKVKVLEVDMPRKRIALTMRMSDPAEKRPAGRQDDNRAAFQKHRAQSEKKPAGTDICFRWRSGRCPAPGRDGQGQPEVTVTEAACGGLKHIRSKASHGDLETRLRGGQAADPSNLSGSCRRRE